MMFNDRPKRGLIAGFAEGRQPCVITKRSGARVRRCHFLRFFSHVESMFASETQVLNVPL